MSYDQYLALGFAVLFASFTLGFKDRLIKQISGLFSSFFMLQFVSDHLNQRSAKFILLSFSYALVLVAFFYSVLLLKFEKAMHKKAYIDSLTGVNNRNFFEDVLKNELRLYQDAGTHYCILFLDMDNFKNINDTYGHTVGDNVLSEIGKRLKTSLASNGFIVRYGGDEFLVVLKEVKRGFLDTVIESVRNSLSFKVNDLTIRVSVGYALYPEDGSKVEDLIKVASERMYEDKRRCNDMDNKGKEKV
ncbi:MAG: GGDEF domain-containing protein [Aquificaceae bacterium]